MHVAGALRDNDIQDVENFKVQDSKPPSKKLKKVTPTATKQAEAAKPPHSKPSKASMPTGEMLMLTSQPQVQTQHAPHATPHKAKDISKQPPATSLKSSRSSPTSSP